MSASQNVNTSAVVRAMRRLYPEELADKSWDNTGLLIDNFDRPHSSDSADRQRARVMLTIDITPAVTQEALDNKVDVIVSYHPFIFRGLKSITAQDPQQSLMLQLIQNNIAVYCPHTAVDAVPGGLNDWLATIILGSDTHDSEIRAVEPAKSPAPLPEGFEGAGSGRVFTANTTVATVIERLVHGLDAPMDHVMVAAPCIGIGKGASKDTQSLHQIKATRVAVCAGSGASVLKDVDADVLVTGEMSHHDALRATMLGKTVITVFHSNSERNYLKQRMLPELRSELAKGDGRDIEVIVSERDRDPFEIVKVREPGEKIA